MFRLVPVNGSSTASRSLCLKNKKINKTEIFVHLHITPSFFSSKLEEIFLQIGEIRKVFTKTATK